MVARVKTWTTSETLASSDLNTEFNNIVNAISSSTADHIDLADVYAWTGAHSWSAATTHTNTLTVGVNDTGHDVKFFGATSGQYMLWDESADELVLAGDSKLSFHDAAGGENIIATSNGHLEVNAGTTLDITAPTVDLNSSTEFNIDTAAYDLNASGAVTIDSAGVSIDSSAASNLTTSGGALTITSAAAATWSTAAGALTLSSGAALNLTPASGSVILLDGTISIDAGVVTGATAITLSGELDAGSLDISGNADIDGTLEADAITIGSTAIGSIYGVVAGSSSIVTVGTIGTGTWQGTAIAASYVATLNQDTTGTAALATTVTITDNESTNEDNAIIFTAGGDVDGGNLGLESDGDLIYNPSTGTVTATIFKGNIDAVDGDFDGTLEADAITLGGTALGSLYSPIAGSSSIVTTGALNSGSITSGFGTIDTGSSTITTTGAVATGALTSAGAITTTAANAANTANTGKLSFEGSNVTQLGAWGADTSTAGILKFTTRSSDSSVNNTGIVIDGSGDVAIGTTTPAGALSVYGISRFSRQDSTPTGTANTIMNDAVFGSIETAHTGITILGTGQLSIAFGDAASTEIGQIRYQHSSDVMEFRTNGATAMTIDSSSSLLIGETANANMTVGLTINQGANDDEILALKSSDVGHTVTNFGEADTYGLFMKSEATSGGLLIRGLKDADGNAGHAVLIQGCLSESAADTTKNVAGIGAITISGFLANASNNMDSLGADENILVVTNGSNTRFIFDAEGTAHADVGTATYSDARLKSNIRDLPYGIDTVKALQPRIFDRQSGFLNGGEVVLEDKKRVQIGLIAQECKDLIAELVIDPANDSSFYSMDYARLSVVNLAAIKELISRVEKLEMN